MLYDINPQYISRIGANDITKSFLCLFLQIREIEARLSTAQVSRKVQISSVFNMKNGIVLLFCCLQMYIQKSEKSDFILYFFKFGNEMLVENSFLCPLI